MSIGKTIKKLRESKNMSLEDVAKLCNTTRQTIYKYENEIVTNIPYDKIELLSKALNTTPAYLMGWEENNTTAETNSGISEAKQKLFDLAESCSEDEAERLVQMMELFLKRK